jgi:hypothetical protein
MSVGMWEGGRVKVWENECGQTGMGVWRMSVGMWDCGSGEMSVGV